MIHGMISNSAIKSLFSRYFHRQLVFLCWWDVFYDWKLLATQRSNRCFLAHTYIHGHDIFLRWRDIFCWRSGFVVVGEMFFCWRSGFFVVGDMLGDNLSVGEAAIVLVGEALFWWWKRENFPTKSWTTNWRSLGQHTSVYIRFADVEIM